MKIITDLNEINPLDWESFVLNHPKGNVFHTHQMVKVYEETDNYIPVTLFAVDDNNIIGILIGVIQREYKGLLGYLSSRCIVWGGPLVLENNLGVSRVLINSLVKHVGRKSIYIQFRNLFNLENLRSVFETFKFTYKPHLDILIDINRSFDDLISNVHSSRKRNYTKSKNKEVVFKELLANQDVEQAYTMIRQTYNRVKHPAPTYSLIHAIFSNLIPNKLAEIYGAFYRNELIGTRVVLKYKNLIYDYYAGSNPEHSNKYPNDFLILEILKKGCETNFELFDFGGAGSPNEEYGVRTHKQKFGGVTVEYGRFIRINNKLFFLTVSFIYNIWKKIKK